MHMLASGTEAGRCPEMRMSGLRVAGRLEAVELFHLPISDLSIPPRSFLS